MIISQPEQVTAAWLATVLRANGHLPQGEVEQLGRRSSRPFGSLVLQLEASYSADAPLDLPSRLFLKVDEGSNDDAGAREATFYRQIAPQMDGGPGVPCYDVGYDTKSGAYHLLLADASQSHYSIEREAPATAADTQKMLDALARLHARWWGCRLPVQVGLIDAELPAPPLSDFLAFMGDRLSSERQAIYQRVLERLPLLLAGRLAQSHDLTLVHDDAHPWNFLLPHQPERDPVYLVDWQQWGLSIGPHDVSYLLTLFWYPERRARFEGDMVRWYHQRLVHYGVDHYPWSACWQDYRLFTLRNLLVPLWAWFRGHWGFHRWMQIEKGMAAYHDLNCGELLQVPGAWQVPDT